MWSGGSPARGGIEGRKRRGDISMPKRGFPYGVPPPQRAVLPIHALLLFGPREVWNDERGGGDSGRKGVYSAVYGEFFWPLRLAAAGLEPAVKEAGKKKKGGKRRVLVGWPVDGRKRDRRTVEDFWSVADQKEQLFLSLSFF